MILRDGKCIQLLVYNAFLKIFIEYQVQATKVNLIRDQLYHT